MGTPEDEKLGTYADTIPFDIERSDMSGKLTHPGKGKIFDPTQLVCRGHVFFSPEFMPSLTQ